MAKTTTKNQRIAKTRTTALERILSVIVTILVISQILSLVVVRNLQHQSDITAAHLTADSVAYIVKRGNQPLPVDPLSGQIYFSNVRLKLPPLPASPGRLVYEYSYWGGSSSVGAELSIVSNNDVSQAENPVLTTPFDSANANDITSKIESCGEGVMIALTPHPELGGEGSKVLANGKVAYFYTDPHHGCDDNTLLNYVKQIESY